MEDGVGWVDRKVVTRTDTEYRLGPIIVLVPEGFEKLESGARVRKAPSEKTETDRKPIVVTFPVHCYPSVAIEAWATRNDDKHSISFGMLEHLRA